MGTRRGLRVAAIAAAGGLLGGAAAAVALGSVLWHRATARTVRRLRLNSDLSRPAVFSPKELRELPDPVVRYFTFALMPGQPFFRRARVDQAGRIRTGDPNAPWHPFTAVEHFTVLPPGFVWDARIRMAPLLVVRVRDGYVAGSGAVLGKLAALVTVADQHGRPGLNAGALHRYLAEAVWCPTALLPRAGVVWDAVDARTARATVTDRGTSVSLEFQFGPEGEIVSAYTPTRCREVNGADVPTPWRCDYRRYAPVHGVTVPLEGEVAWEVPEGRLPYWQGRVLGVEYNVDL
jgi:uncharacterized protein DUF6544